MHDTLAFEARALPLFRGRGDARGASAPRIIFLFLAVLAVAACDGSISRAEESKIGPTEIWIRNYQFLPLHQYAVPGAEVTWINQDTVAHTVVSGTPDDPGRFFESDTLQPGGTFSHTFYETENYRYHCSLHADRIRILNDMPVLLVTPLVQPTGT